MSLTEMVDQSLREGFIIFAALFFVATILASTKEISILLKFIWSKKPPPIKITRKKSNTLSKEVVEDRGASQTQAQSDNNPLVKNQSIPTTPTASKSRLPVCTNCGHQGRPKLVTKGSIFIEIVGWCCFLIPGILYSLWRHASRHRACPACGAPNMAPVNSIVAQKMLNG